MRSSLLRALAALAIVTAFGIVPAAAQSQTTALERGYRTGYSDGFSAGSKDISDHAPRNY